MILYVLNLNISCVIFKVSHVVLVLYFETVHAVQNPDILGCVVAVTIQFWVFHGKVSYKLITVGLL
jgi:hypothetical protein